VFLSQSQLEFSSRLDLQCLHLIASLLIDSLQNGQVPLCDGSDEAIFEPQCLHLIASGFIFSLQYGHVWFVFSLVIIISPYENKLDIKVIATTRS
jgi:hypothetical protein